MFRPALIALFLAADPVAAPAPPALPAPPAPAARPARPPRPPRPAVEGKLQGEWPAKPSGKRLALTGRMSVDAALEKIADAAGWNLAANTGRAGDRLLVLGMKDASVEEALETVLSGTTLVATRRGSNVTVAAGVAEAVPDAPVLSGFDTPTGKRFTGDFEDEGIDGALRQVAKAAGLSVVLPSGLRGAINGSFKDAPVEDVLRVILSQNNLAAAREGSILTVSRREGGRTIISGGGKRRLVIAPMDGVEIEEDLKDLAGDLAAQAKGGKTLLKGHHKNRSDKVVSGDVRIGAGEKVQDVVAMRGSARLEPGATATGLVAILGSVSVGSGANVENDVVAILGDVHLEAGAHVGGDAVSIGGQVIIDEGAEVEGQQVSVDVPGMAKLLGSSPVLEKASEKSWALRAGGFLAQFATFFVLGLLFLLLAPRRLDSVAASLAHRPVKTVMTGLLGTIALPILTVLLVVTVIGIPLVAVQVLGVLLAAILGFTALALYLGRALPLPSDRGGQVARLALGTLLLVVLFRIPVLGILAGLTGWLVVFGAVILTRFGQPQPVLESTAVPPSAPPPPPPPPAPVA